MNIRDEYARFVNLTKVAGSWQQIDDAWARATNHEKNERGEWIKLRQSWGPLVRGFAIDPVTWKYVVGNAADHHQPFIELTVTLIKGVNDLAEARSIQERLIEGRLAYTDISTFPLATCIGMWIFQEPELLRHVEEKILEFGIGLPMSGLHPQIRNAQKRFSKFK